MPRRLLFTLAVLFTISGLAIAVTGGGVTTLFGMRLSARSAVPTLVLAAATYAVWLRVAFRAGAVREDLEAVHRWMERRIAWLVAVTAAVAAIVAAACGSVAATGADSSGYLSYAALLLDGRLMRPEPLASIATWPDGPATLAPLGWRAAADAGWQVPTYAIGLPLLIGPFAAAAGAAGVALVVPAAFAVAVWTIAQLARRAAGAPAAILAAVWFATSPAALVHSMQVMSDVPATAAWMLCWWLVFSNRPLAAGLASAMAVLIRPNLAPLALLPALALLLRGQPGEDRGERWRRVAQFAAPVALAGACVGWLQLRYFGSPLRSGYGTAREIYALSNVAPNAVLYTRWLMETHGPWLLVSPLALLVRTPGAADRRRELVWLFGFAALVVAAYLVYAVFESWTYLRFMLPALAVAAIALAALFAALLARLPRALRGLMVLALGLAVAAVNVASARTHGVFQLADRQAHARVVATRLVAELPANAVIISGEQSGAMRYYTGLSILRWDLIEPGAMAEALDRLRLNGHPVWVVLDDWEEEAFRRKFPELAAATIDRRPVVQSAPGRSIGTRAWIVSR